jgi:hypothetical protein
VTYEDAQRTYDNETPEDYEVIEDTCPDCGQRKCVCTGLDGLDD